MTPFLKLVADDVYKRFNGHLEDVAVVFPNKRAGLFFNRYLLESGNNAPMWSPKYLTIGELFQQNSKLAHRVEPLEQVVDMLRFRMKEGHIDRLQTGSCTQQTGFVFIRHTNSASLSIR